MLLSDFHEGISSVLDWLHVCKDTAVSKLSAMFLYLILFGGHILSILSAISMKWGGHNFRGHFVEERSSYLKAKLKSNLLRTMVVNSSYRVTLQNRCTSLCTIEQG